MRNTARNVVVLRSYGLLPFIYFDPEVSVTLSASNITSWTDKASGFAATQATASAQPTYATLGSYKYVQVLNNNSKVLTFSLPANSGAIVGRAYFGFGNSVFACDISIPNSASATTLELGRHGDYLTGVIIFKGFPGAVQELEIINGLTARVNNTPSKVIDYFFYNFGSKLTNRITKVSGNTVAGVTSAIGAWQQSGLVNFSNNSFPAATTLYASWYNCTALTTFTNNNFPAATNLQQAWYLCTALTTFSNTNSFPAATILYASWQQSGLVNFSNIDSFPAATNLLQAWQQCTALTTFTNNSFPAATNLTTAWQQCTALTTFTNNSFPAATNLFGSWYLCSALTTFSNTNSFPAATNLDSAWQQSGLVNFSNIDSFPAATNLLEAWYLCSTLTTFTNNSFPAATNLFASWYECSDLTTFTNNSFPAATNLFGAWYLCSALTTFSNTNSFPAATNLDSAWQQSGLVNFSNIDSFPAATNLLEAWYLCSTLTTFTNNSFPAATNLTSAWQQCTNLTTFGRFNSPNVVNVSAAWNACALTQESVDDILISLAAGVANNTTKTGFVGTSALTGGTNAAPGTTVRTLSNSWETALSQVNETLGGTTYNFSGGITGQQAKAWLLAKKSWTVQTN